MSNAPGERFRTIWLHPDDPAAVQIIDQRRLPHRYEVVDLRNHGDGAFAIREMLVRGAPLTGTRENRWQTSCSSSTPPPTRSPQRGRRPSTCAGVSSGCWPCCQA